MGCFSSRQRIKIDQGIVCDEGYPTNFSQLNLYVFLKDPISEKLISKNVEFFQDYLIMLRFKEIIRSTDFCTVRQNGLLFDIHIAFDAVHLKNIMENPLEVEINCNEMFNGKISLPQIKNSIFYLSKEEIVLKNIKGQELPLALSYGWSGEYFDKILNFSHENFSQSEQYEIINQALKCENVDYKELSFDVKKMIDSVITNKDSIYEIIVAIQDPGPKAFDLLETLFKNYNPYTFGLFSSFKLFMKNVVGYTERFDAFAIDLIMNNYDEFLIYENVESLKIMLKEMFRTSKDPEGYFIKYARKNGESTLFKDIFQNEWLFNSLILPSFNKDVITAMNLCVILDKFDGFEDYFLSNANKLSHINFDEIFLENEHAHIINLIKTPDFHNIRLRVLNIHGHGEPTLSSFLGCQNIQGMMDSKCFSSNKGEIKNLTIIAEQIEQKTIFATHVYLYSPGSLYNSSLIKALFFLAENLPNEDEIKKFYEMKFEDFLNENFHKDDKMVYCGMIDLGDGMKKVNHDYKEIYFEGVIKGKYLIVLCIEATEKATNMDIGKLGCLGFCSEEDSKKYNLKVFKNGKIRVRNKVINYLDTFKNNKN